MKPVIPRLARILRGAGLGVCLWLAVALVIFLASTPGSFAQSTPAASPAMLSSNRFLFVIDTSGPMHKHLQDVVGVVETILRSSASGQLRNGDSIGVWTFNENIYTGNMPLQTWSVDDGEEITLRIAEFIRQQDFGKKSRLDLAMVPVAKVVKMSDIITVFVISSGAGPIRGTPYDDDINMQYELCLRDMGKTPMPLVTVLQGKRGRFIRYTVNALPWPVVIPELPIPLKLAGEPSATPDAAPAAAPPVVAANVPATPAVQTPPAQEAPALIPPPMTPPPNQIISPPTPPVNSSVGQPHPISQSTPPPAAETTPAAATPAIPTPAPAPVIPQVAQVAPEPPTPPARPPVVVRAPTSDRLPIVPPRQPPLVQKAMPATGVMAEPVVPPVQPPISAPEPVQASAPVARAPVPAAAPPAPAATPAPPPQKTLVTQATALVKSFTGEHRSLLLIGGISLLVVATALIMLMARRSRSSGRVSLITQTMDDHRR